MRRFVALIALAGMTFLGLVSVGRAQAKVPDPNGRIVFMRRQVDIEHVFRNFAYTVNPDGSELQQVTSKTSCPELPRTRCTGELARWSPDGSEISITTDFCNAGQECAAFIVDPDTGAVREVPNPDPTLALVCGAAWSPDGTRLACSSVNEDIGGDPSRDGIYTIRSSDGGGLARVTDFISFPGDYSPDGTRLTFQTFDENEVWHLFVVNLDGSGLTQITPPDLAVNPGIGVSWSPDGTRILFSGRADPDHRTAIWVVNPDGSGLQQVPIPGCGGLRSDPTSVGCFQPHWSPDGTKLAFDLLNPRTGLRHIDTVNADGSGLFQITKSGLEDFDPDWGPHPLAT